MTKETREEVPRGLLEPVVAYFNPCRVILFGSHAHGETGPDSDYDLLVVVDDDTPQERLSWRAKYEARRGYHGPVDIVTCRESMFRRKAVVVGSLAHLAAETGVVVYERR